MKIFFSIFLGLSLLLAASHSYAISTSASGQSHVQKGNKYFNDGRHFMAIDEYKSAIKEGIKSPSVFRNLAIMYYELGFLDEAIVALKEAVTLFPDSDFLSMELGIVFMAKGKLEDAKKQFMGVLQRNPGFSDAYYYLGEIFYRQQQYSMAWMFAGMARRLGHSGKELVSKLQARQEAPAAEPWNFHGKTLSIRQIFVNTKEKAEALLKRISEGELFEMLASQENEGTNKDHGGFLGKFNSSDVHPKIATALLEREVLSEPIIVETEAGYHIVQLIVPFNFREWEEKLAQSGKPDEKAVQAGQIKQPPDQQKKKTPVQQKTGFFLVFIGAYSDEKNATDALQKLQKLGYPSYRIRQKTKTKGVLHMVIAGKYESLQKAKKIGQSV
jgi:tetratricopeptide (TPR) repeat protein